MATHKKAENFYRDLIALLLAHDIPFMIGGTNAFRAYTEINRPTKDMDIFTTDRYYPTILQIAKESGYKTDVYDKAWIAKIYQDNFLLMLFFQKQMAFVK